MSFSSDLLPSHMVLQFRPAPPTCSLRAIDPERYTIVNEAAGGEVIEEIEVGPCRCSGGIGGGGRRRRRLLLPPSAGKA